MAKHWGKVLTAMVTPFDGDGRLNLDAARALARHLADNGSDALVLAATTGEAPTLDDAERFDLIRAVSDAVTIPVLAGTGSNDTRHALAMTARAEAAGAAGVFLVSPYYNRPPQAGIEAHFRALAAATRLPVMIYDVPGRTGRRIAHDVLLRLFLEVDNIVAFKDATCDPAAAARLVAEAGERFELYSGDDALTLPLLAVARWRGGHLHPLDRPGVRRDDRRLRAGRCGPRPRDQRRVDAVLCLFQHRRFGVLDVGEGDAARPGPGCRRMQAPAAGDACRRRGARRRHMARVGSLARRPALSGRRQ
ncbi:Dihydrodipicolinate synthase [Chromobacterium violaceum]|uniref:Dihydrodipicolinate synthase n=1 Tax=Chromobacterium violaceum TaxID=536 RepID=A0A3S4LHJ3_CHRVL|nr:Dihydrodipicolinate synthase [Chromobacterium violaceum]